ncbi:polysaccharide pyruvyl transferase family protein [Vibrio splendidus]|uniref:polysaccharide pyruvyl transferase family protein n=1 Tax=Vibrio splendidus TaxID=29497 RepID=UPI000D367FF6|nr:polysaccharide pyruvyl transferase family protein [Vibrio splendidus]PTO65220.1 hypothetical protein CWN99_08845 [Vibrio splendidus]
MNVATLTLPLHPNYGATLQAYALQQAISRLGYTCKVIDVERNALRSTPRRILYNLRQLFTEGRIDDNKDYGNEKFRNFIVNELSLTAKVSKSQDFKRKDILSFDAYVVGSDQVWRPSYAINVKRYYFDFAPLKAKKISYAASFGTDFWEYSNDLKTKCKYYLDRFSRVSVRESGGMKNCKDHFDIDTKFVLDPTLLIERTNYNNIIEKYANGSSIPKVYAYILDQSIEKLSTIKEFDSESVVANEGLNDSAKMGLGDWLKNIRDTSFFITDSFHGVVFAIIFNKQFVAIGNAKRGLSRFQSVLATFGLEERLILDDSLSVESLIKIREKEIDFGFTNEKKDHLVKESISFLKNSLSSD